MKSSHFVRRFAASLAVASLPLLAIAAADASPAAASSAAAAAPLPEIYNADSDAQTVEGDPGQVSRVFLRFGRSGDLSAPSSVKLTLVDGTAKRGSDYAAPAYTKTLQFAAGEDFTSFFVNIRTDYVVEPDETFSWQLSDPAGATIRSDSTDGSVAILDDDSAEPPTFSAEDPYYPAENNFAATTADFTITRSGSLAAAAWVKAVTVDGTAVAPGDYKSRSITLYFAPGVKYREVHVPITNDVEPEPLETFSLHLSAPIHATITDDTGVATIHDDDSSATPTLAPIDEITPEGDSYAHSFRITIRRQGDLRGTSTVTYTTSDGTAHAPGDYVARTGTLTFGPGVHDQTFTVSVKGDRSPDEYPLKYFFVTLSDPSDGTTIPDPVGQMYIEDDD